MPSIKPPVTIEVLARGLTTTVEHLRTLSTAFERGRSYTHHNIPKKDTTKRQISEPAERVRPFLDNLDAWLKSTRLLPVHEAAHGFVAGRSSATHAAPHAGAAVLVGMDLQDWFMSVTTKQLETALRAVGWTTDAAHITARLATDVDTGALPQGAPTSPLLANFVARHLDKHLSQLATRFGMVYTRYADDLAFSSPTPMATSAVERFLQRAERWINSEGFRVKYKKTTITRTWQQMVVAGNVVVNPEKVEARGIPVGDSRIRVCRRYVRQVQAAIHNYKHGRARWSLEQIRSAIGYVQMVNPEQAQKLRSKLEEK